eukprot:Em0001g34a
MESVLESFLDQCASPQEMARALKSSMPESQLETLTQLMQQSPEILLQLGITPDLITAERTKRDALLKVKNTTVEEKQSSDGQLWMTWLEAYKARLLQEVEGVASHEDLMKINSERERKMKASNPRFVLRNHIAQQAIELAENGDFSEVTRVQKMLQKPYSLPESGSNTTTLAEDDRSLTRRSYEKPPEWAACNLKIPNWMVPPFCNKDILVHCVSCSRDVTADTYEVHKCTPSLTPDEEREAVVLLKKAISTSTEKGIIHLATGGTPMTFIQVTKARNPTTSVSSRTVKMRCSEMQTMQSIVSGGEPSALIQNKVLALNDEERSRKQASLPP